MKVMHRSVLPRQIMRILCFLLTVLAALTLCSVALAADEPDQMRITDPASLDMTAPDPRAKALADKAMSYAGMTRTML